MMKKAGLRMDDSGVRIADLALMTHRFRDLDDATDTVNRILALRGLRRARTALCWLNIEPCAVCGRRLVHARERTCGERGVHR